jgi:hypothetical protein
MARPPFELGPLQLRLIVVSPPWADGPRGGDGVVPVTTTLSPVAVQELGPTPSLAESPLYVSSQWYVPATLALKDAEV